MDEPQYEYKASIPERQALRVPPLIKLSDAAREDLKTWLSESLPTLRRIRADRISKRPLYEATLRGVRLTAAPTRGVSNLSVPLTMWVDSGIRARLYEGALNTRPFVTAEPLDQTATADAQIMAKNLAKFFEHAIMSPRMVNGRNAGRKALRESASYGTAAILTRRKPDMFELIGPRTADAKPMRVPVRGQPEWVFVSEKNLILWPGYGDNVNAMPYVGHEYDKTWSEIEMWEEYGYYEDDACERVKAHYLRDKGNNDVSIGNNPASLVEHRITELYLDYPIDSSGSIASIIIDWHNEAEEILRITWNYQRHGDRPLRLFVFDEDPDSTQPWGLGICAKLQGAQEEADMVHNIAIESGKKAAACLVMVRVDTNAEDELGGQDGVIPGDVIATGNPEEDVVTKNLGDPNAAIVALQLEDHTRGYLTQMFGFDQSRVGDVTAGKRVPGGLGMSIQREGRAPIANALANASQSFTDLVYMLGDLYKDDVPFDQLVAAVGREAADQLLATVFSARDRSLREQFVITFNVQDAAAIQEQRKQEIMVLTQFLFTLYDKLLQYAGMAMQVPPQMQGIIVETMTKLQNSVKLLLANVESIQNPSEVLPDIARQVEALGQMTAGIVQSGGAPGLPTPNPEMGGGVT